MKKRISVYQIKMRLTYVATNDILKVLNKNISMRTKHTAVMSKCNILWNKAGRPKSAEIIKATLGQTLRYPGITRWNSVYDSISQIIKIKNLLPDLYKKLDIKTTFQMLKDSVLEYLQEYCNVLHPIAQALDILQGESNTYYGYLLPTLLSLFLKFQGLKIAHGNICPQY